MAISRASASRLWFRSASCASILLIRASNAADVRHMSSAPPIPLTITAVITEEVTALMMWFRWFMTSSAAARPTISRVSSGAAPFITDPRCSDAIGGRVLADEFMG